MANEETVNSTGSAPRRRARTARGEATRARIVDAAADLMYAHGVRATSLDDVREATATSKSQLYHYFADKDDLVQAVIVRQTERILIAQQPLLHEVSSFAGLRAWRDAVVTMNRQRDSTGGCPLGSLASELADYSDDARRVVAESFGAWQAHIAYCLHAMRERGQLLPEADPDALAESIMAALQGGLLLAQTTRSTRPLERGLNMALDYAAAYAPDAA